MVEKSRKNVLSITGSPDIGEPVFLAIGILRKPHGVEGEMVMELLTDFPERISKKKKVYLGEGHIISKIITIHSSGVGLLVHLENIEKREEAQKLRNTVVYVRSDEIPNLPLGNFYHYQVMGMMVYKADKSRLGIIIDIISTGSNDVYVIRPDSGNEKEILLPAITSVILEINLEKRMMIVNLPNWG